MRGTRGVGSVCLLVVCLLVPGPPFGWGGWWCGGLVVGGWLGTLSGSGAVRPWALPGLVCLCGGSGSGVGGLVVNCIVDASIFVLCDVRVLLCLLRPWSWGCGGRVFCLFVFMSVRWMPWHQGPMKDVVACDIPRGAG